MLKVFIAAFVLGNVITFSTDLVAGSSQSRAGIAGSNPTGHVDVCLL
jgi:hypothetical protein